MFRTWRILRSITYKLSIIISRQSGASAVGERSYLSPTCIWLQVVCMYCSCGHYSYCIFSESQYYRTVRCTLINQLIVHYYYLRPAELPHWWPRWRPSLIFWLRSVFFFLILKFIFSYKVPGFLAAWCFSEPQSKPSPIFFCCCSLMIFFLLL